MVCVAEFGIIKDFDPYKEYSYEPELYNCVSINEDYINDWWKDLISVKTYHHKFSCESFALARWGVTLIPPESLELFYNKVRLNRALWERYRTSAYFFYSSKHIVEVRHSK